MHHVLIGEYVIQCSSADAAEKEVMTKTNMLQHVMQRERERERLIYTLIYNWPQ
jgi:hypothetical protein